MEESREVIMETYSKQLSDLSDYALIINGTKNQYSDEDMINATLVFMEVFSSLMFDYHSDKLNQGQMEQLFTESGETIRQTIMLFTGIDTKKFFEK